MAFTGVMATVGAGAGAGWPGMPPCGGGGPAGGGGPHGLLPKGAPPGGGGAPYCPGGGGGPQGPAPGGGGGPTDAMAGSENPMGGGGGAAAAGGGGCTTVSSLISEPAERGRGQVTAQSAHQAGYFVVSHPLRHPCYTSVPQHGSSQAASCAARTRPCFQTLRRCAAHFRSSSPN